MIKPDEILESLVTVMADSSNLDSLMVASLDLLIKVSRASGGYLRVVDAAGEGKTVRKHFSREAFQMVNKPEYQNGKVKAGVMSTSTGKVLIFLFCENETQTGFVALDYRSRSVASIDNNTGSMETLVRLIGYQIVSRCQAEMMHRRYEEYKRVIEKAPIGILIFDHSGKLTSINPFHTSGLPAHRGKDLIRTTNVLHDESIKQAGLLNYFKKLLGGEPFELFNHPYTTMFMKKNVFVDVRGVPLIGSEGKIEGGIVLINNVTEKAWLEEELRNSRDHLENIINSIDNEIIVVDRNHTIQLVNNAYIRNYNLESSSLIGMKCYYVSHGKKEPCTLENRECPVSNVFADGRTRTMIHRHQGKHGPRSVEVTYTPLKDSEGEVVNVIIVAQDITERLVLEVEREKTREELRAVFEGITDSIMVIDRDLKIIKANSGSGLLYHLRTDDIIGKKCLDVIRGSGGGFLDCPAEKTFKTGHPLTLSDCLLEIANQKLYADLFTYPSFDQDGNISHVIMYIRDVTERKLLERKYRDREALLANISSDSADAIFSLDDDDIITSWNKGAQKMFGYEEKEVVGKNIELLIPEEGKKQFEEIRTILYREGFVRNVEARWQTKDGREVEIIFTRTTLTDADGNVVGSSIVIKDISRLKEMGRELIHVEKLAVLGKMSATVAHEIRNPLGSITLNLDILEEEIGSSRGEAGPHHPRALVLDQIRAQTALADIR